MFGGDVIQVPEFCLRATPLVVLVAACSPVEGAQEAPRAAVQETQSALHPISGLEIAPVTVVRGEKRITFKTEMALSTEAQARGLMFRTELADDEAMLFPSDVPAQRSFWMKNTPISLDIIFIGVDNRISNIETAVPYSLDSVVSIGATNAVLEIRGGLAKEMGIVAGDKVEWTLPEGGLKEPSGT